MPGTRIKFCGITRPVDAVAAATAGADAIGLIFFDKSPRHVSIDRAREILNALPPMVSPVALFVNAPVSEIIRTVGKLNIRTVQLHGGEPPDYLSQLPDLTIIKAIHCTPEKLTTLSQWQSAAGILLETAGAAVAGGSGITNDWGLVQLAMEQFKDTPVIAAGGLTPANVGDVVRRIRPWAVDVSTGIEESPGIKSVEKMRQFADAVRSAESQR